MNKSLILLSGGLDSVVSLAVTINDFDSVMAITFNYGQKAFLSERNASENIAKFYNIEHKVIDLPWLEQISTSSLNTDKVPEIKNTDLDNPDITKKSAQSVWVPNRNALFINIAACFAEAYDYNYIILGANKEEGMTFKDNTIEFINAQNNLLKYSVNKDIKLIAPLIEYSKKQIVQKAIELNIPFEYIYSCYKNGKKHCGVCESCQRLKRSLELNNRHDIINKIFD